MINNKKIGSKFIRWLFLGVLLGNSLWVAAAGLSVEDIDRDIKEFQQFFLDRFPGVPLNAYNDGVNALPQYARHKLNWSLQMEFPPYSHDLELGQQEWKAVLPSGATLEECFAGKPPPSAYPYFFDDTVHTIVGDINFCLEFNGAKKLDGMGVDMARLVAAFKSPWNGLVTDIDYRDQEIRNLYAKGKQLFWAKRGQLNMSCANCHVHNAGNQLRGDVISAALGHTSGYPAYRTEWAFENQPLGTIHRRYAQCNEMVGAVPFAAQSEEYIALEIYQAIMNKGIPLKVPSLRP